MKRLLCLLPLALLFIACSDDNKGTNPTQTQEVWPLKVGNQWVGEDTEVDSAGNILRVDTTILAVSKDTVIGGERWYIITVNGNRDPEVPILASRSDGLWAGGPSGGLFLKYPAAVNDTFMMGSQVVVVESVHDTVTVPAGTFVCLNYKWPEPSTSERPYQLHYYSPGIGGIKAVEYRKTAGGYIYPNFQSVLISYTLH